MLPTWRLGRRGRQECVGQDPDSRRRPPVDPDYQSAPRSIKQIFYCFSLPLLVQITFGY
jgi:hypothetical protein